MPSLANSSYFTFQKGGLAGADYAVRLSNNYEAIASILGLTKVSADGPLNGSVVTVNEACRQGALIKLRINYRIGTTKRGSANVVCSTDKVDEAIKGVVKKPWGSTGVITSIRGVPKIRYF